VLALKLHYGTAHPEQPKTPRIHFQEGDPFPPFTQFKEELSRAGNEWFPPPRDSSHKL